ncbi:MAG: biopolymer transporter ExbD [Pseudomonadota bacterium]
MIAPRRRRRRTLSITSLIDVIFLLLLFFMLASTFRQFSELEVTSTAAKVGGAASAQDPVLTLVVQPALLTLDGASAGDAQIVERLRVRSDTPKRLNLKVAPGVTSQRLVEILVLLDPIAGLEVNLMAGA